MKQKCNDNIRKSLELSRNLMILADVGEADSEDNGCILLYSVLRDCAYKIKSEAEREREVHKKNKKWA